MIDRSCYLHGAYKGSVCPVCANSLGDLIDQAWDMANDIEVFRKTHRLPHGNSDMERINQLSVNLANEIQALELANRNDRQL